jgi:uncharacterized protein (DUF927 family)
MPRVRRRLRGHHGRAAQPLSAQNVRGAQVRDMTVETPTFDLAECAQFIAFWCRVTGAPHLTLTAITPDGPTTTATFTAADTEKAGSWIARAQAAGRNVYFQVNETPTRCVTKPKKEAIIAAIARHADVDPVDASHSYAEERDRLHRLAEFLLADPTMPPTAILDSGNGIQPLWAAAREPLTPEIIERIENENRAIEAAVGASGTHNIDRLLRLPGTLNYPNAKKQKLGRGVTRARLLHQPEATYTTEQVGGLGAHLQKLLAGTGLVRPPAAPDQTTDPDMQKRKAAKARGDRSALAFGKGAALRRAGKTFEEMCEALHADPETAEWCREKGDADGGRELQRIWDRAEALPPVGGAAEWLAGFFATREGVWYQPPPTRGRSDVPTWICAPFTVVAETADEAGGAWGLLLEWRDRDDRAHRWAAPRRLLHADGNQIAAELDHAGLTVGTNKAPHELLKALLGSIRTPSRKLCVATTGWHQTDAGHAYVLPSGETFGAGGDDIILQTDHVASIKATQPRGTLAEWQQHVARYAVGNHRLGLFISAAFAAPLLDVTGEPSGGLHLHGGSQSGKTTCLACAASAWGRADTSGQIRTWRATANGMEATAAETCDACLFLDEISMVDPRETGEIVYALANESGKARATRDGSARARRTWRNIFLSTGEISLAAKMGERGATPMAGQDVRLANIPADAGAGLGVFQQLHGMKNAAALAVHLRAAARTYYGTAARAYLDELTEERTRDPEGLVAVIAELRGKFLDKMLPAGADGQVISVARRMSLIAAAGELASMFGVLPWPEGEAMNAAATGLRAWIKARGGTGAGEDTQAIAAVRRFIEQHGESRFSLLQPAGRNDPDAADAAATEGGADDHETITTRLTIYRAGYRRTGPDGGLFLIFPEQWRTEVCRGLDPDRAAAALSAAGFLEKGEGRNWPRKQRIPGIGTTRLYTVSGKILQGDT